MLWSMEEENIAAIRRVLAGLDEMESWLPELRQRAESVLAGYFGEGDVPFDDVHAAHSELVDRMEKFGTTLMPCLLARRAH